MKEIRYNLKTYYHDETVIDEGLTLEEVFEKLDRYTKYKANICELFKYEIEQKEVN